MRNQSQSWLSELKPPLLKTHSKWRKKEKKTDTENTFLETFTISLLVHLHVSN